MIEKIDALLEELESVCDEFDYIADAESNWRTACRIATYRDHVKSGYQGLREMRDYLKSHLTDWQIEQLQAGYNAE